MKLYKINKDHELILNIEENDNNICLYDDLKEQIIKKKSEIDKYNSKDWENSKKKLCKYENIYSSSSKRYKNICNIVPVSRSYFKLHEMIYDFNLLKNIDGSIFCCCIAEGPGGFIHCLNDFNKIINGKINKIYGITLISEDNTVPYWNISILKNNTNKIFLNDNNDGNIYNINIVNSFLEFVEEKCDLITSDGGFDYSNDYNKQELNSYRLLYCEIFTALNIQKQGGCFIIKIFDIFYYKTLQLIYFHQSYNKFQLYVKMHPNDSLDPNLYFIARKQLGLTTREIKIDIYDFPELSVYDVIQASQIVISRSSTAIEEALLLNKMVVAYDLFEIVNHPWVIKAIGHLPA